VLVSAMPAGYIGGTGVASEEAMPKRRW
jgi:hypothetical protein